MDTFLSIIQYQSEADQVMLVKNSSKIFYYSENPDTGVNVMVAVLNGDQKQELTSKGYIVQTIQTNPDTDKYQLVNLDFKAQASFYSTVGKVYVLEDKTALVRFNDDVSVMQLGESEITKSSSLVDIRNQLAEKNQINLHEETTQNTTSPSQENTDAMQPEVWYYVAAIVIFLALLLASAYIYFRTHHRSKIS